MKGGMIMNGDFWQSFLMISDIYTVGFWFYYVFSLALFIISIANVKWIFP